VACLSACLLLPAVYVCCFEIKQFQRFKQFKHFKHFKHSNIQRFEGFSNIQRFKHSNIPYRHFQTLNFQRFKHSIIDETYFSCTQTPPSPNGRNTRVLCPRYLRPKINRKTNLQDGQCKVPVHSTGGRLPPEPWTQNQGFVSTARGGDSPLSHGRKTRVLCPQLGGRPTTHTDAKLELFLRDTVV